MSILVASVLIAGAAMAIGSLMAALGQGMAVSKAMEGISRQPEAAGKITGTLIIGLAFIESIAIYCLAIAFIILFANPLTKPTMNVDTAKANVEVIKLEIEKIKLEADLKKMETAEPKTEKAAKK